MDKWSIESIKAAESSLRRDDMERLLDEVPADHPIGEAVRKGEIGSADLMGLPDGHPVIRALREAKDRMELVVKREKDEAGAREVRMARRVRKREVENAERVREEERRGKVLKAASIVNDRIDVAIVAIRALADDLRGMEAELMSASDTRARALRLSRIADATLAGLEASRLRVRRI